MSNRRNKRQRIEQISGHMVEADRNLSREMEAWNTPVRPDGIGEDPAITALLTGGYSSNSERLEATLQAQRIIRGKASLLESPKLRDELARLRARARAMDDAEQKYEEDPAKFADEVLDRAQKKHSLTPERREKEVAKGVGMYQEALQMATATRASRRLAIIHELKNGPKEQVQIAGHWETINGSPMLQPEVVIFDGIPPVILKPGVHSVPRIVAQRLREIKLMTDELEERSGALRVTPEGTIRHVEQIKKDWQRLDQKYGIAAP